MVFYGHFFKLENVLVCEKLQELDFPQGGDGKLASQSRRRRATNPLASRRTPSFSLCMMIFFSAYMPPLRLSLARCTSLVSGRQRWLLPAGDAGGYRGRAYPKVPSPSFPRNSYSLIEEHPEKLELGRLCCCANDCGETGLCEPVIVAGVCGQRETRLDSLPVEKSIREASVVSGSPRSPGQSRRGKASRQ